MDPAEVICDVCGRAQAAAAVRAAGDGGIRLNYCPSCQRFACITCWIPITETCRQCFLGGPKFARDRLTPGVADTFEASTPVSPQRRRSASPTRPASSPHVWAVDHTSQPGKSASRWRWAGALITVLVIAAAFLAGAISGLDETPGDEVVSAAPTVQPIGAGSTAVASSPMSPGATYTVKAGDTLVSIAARVYGDESLWRLIHDANRAVIRDPDHLEVGHSLVIPPR